ncbi:MFS transporter [Lophiotrema nucula]|uniref:MFS transporter n=1 Tax=Lophiotrema nucula TaxID=690887 RepID=A0A6A5ZV78_9PLEO|nr:MFS transporter [Lophiotrema nucula]
MEYSAAGLPRYCVTVLAPHIEPYIRFLVYYVAIVSSRFWISCPVRVWYFSDRPLNMQKYQWLCILYVTFGSVFYGYDSGCTTAILGYTSFLEYFKLDATLIGAFNSAYYGGSFIGCVMNWWLPDAIGRLRTIQIASVISLAGVAMQTGAPNFGVFCAGRVIGGIASGLVFSVCPTYASEIAPPKFRGRVGGLYAFNVNASYMLTEWLGLAFYFIRGNASWQLLIGLQLVPAAAMLIASFWMPFSPRWLVMKGRDDEALEVLSKMHRDTPGEDSSFYFREFHQIKAQIELDRSEELGFGAILRKPSYRKRLYLICIFSFFCQLTGIIPIQNYQVVIYQRLGFTQVFSLILTGIWGTNGCFSAIVASLFVVDRLGRRPLLFIAYAFMISGGIMLVGMWAGFEGGGSTNSSLGKAVIFGMFWFEFGYAGFMNIFFATYAGEILPTRVRAVGVACNYVVFNATVIMLSQVTPIAIEHISWRYFLIFVICDIIFIVIFYFFYPETKNKTLEELAEVFGDQVSCY